MSLTLLPLVPGLMNAHRYARLGLEWASTLLAFIALACCAIPYLFYFKGAAIRKHSKYAYSGSTTVAKKEVSAA